MTDGIHGDDGLGSAGQRNGESKSPAIPLTSSRSRATKTLSAPPPKKSKRIIREESDSDFEPSTANKIPVLDTDDDTSESGEPDLSDSEYDSVGSELASGRQNRQSRVQDVAPCRRCHATTQQQYPVQHNMSTSEHHNIKWYEDKVREVADEQQQKPKVIMI
ncbi:unnamed protein product [Zymoseptoria tritici ST99CH_3D7]|uniref:Uncharacterized protein n=1 Tax=Zymoseptoria tritici (strain ST99CH_3D7) TaxID=1276538 RepID=A0A1X7S842_ZYMT9|nr:unnamed protein product [Zymoseptoria tritici ST99CH_3D7]